MVKFMCMLVLVSILQLPALSKETRLGTWKLGTDQLAKEKSEDSKRVDEKPKKKEFILGKSKLGGNDVLK